MPSKAFLQEQAGRGQAERERAEHERAKRELAKSQKPQSYDDFEPISISKLACALFVVILTRYSTTAAATKCQIEELREKGLPADVLSKISQGVIIIIIQSTEAFLMIFISTIEGVPGRAGRKVR